MTEEKRIALVTGSNRGIGLEICRQLARENIRVIMTARDPDKGKEAAEKLKADGADVSFLQLDVTDPAGIQAAVEFVKSNFGRLDILVNNAGVFLDKGTGIMDIDLEVIRRTLEINTLAPLALSRAFMPIMKEKNYGRIVNLSSQLGRLSGMEPGMPAYRISKTALNTVTKLLAGEVRDANILVNSMCPGWTRTDMGGPDATNTVEEGADTATWLATLPDGGPSGGFFQDRKEIEW